MRILYVAMKYDYGKPEQGYSFEHYNFFDCLCYMGHELIYFDFYELMEQRGKEKMNGLLWEVVKSEQPDFMFTMLFTDELDKWTVRRISDDTSTITYNWFCDDHWRFDNYSRHWAPCFNWVSTTAQGALPKYEKIGYKNVIKTQWAFNPFLYRRLDLSPIYDVTFVGQPHGNRRRVIDSLRNAGIEVQSWGTGWENGRISQEEMIRVFNQSRINLNLSNSSVPNLSSADRAKWLARHAVSRTLNFIPFGSRVKSAVKGRLANIRERTEETAAEVVGEDNIEYSEQIKGRNFEVPGCGGFLLTGPADNLQGYYEIGKEVVCYSSRKDLLDKAEYYLSHEEKRVQIAEAGYKRTLAEHTYVHRFNSIFQEIGFDCLPAQDILARQNKSEYVHVIS